MAALAVVTRPTDRETEDDDLVAAVRAGDDHAFEILFERYQGRIATYVRGMVRDHGRAEDVTQEVFISALRRMRETDREIAFRPWLYEIAKNACIDAFRRSRHAPEVSIDAQSAVGVVDQPSRFTAPAVTPDEAIEGKLDFANLRGALGGLSQTHHDILVMREFEGLSYRVIGERLGMSGPAVESTLFRARRRLSEEYEELASGERCRRVQGIVDAPAMKAIGVRDQRRLAKHLSHCQPCRRYARLTGYDLGAVAAARPASAAARIAALVPLPAFLRRRGVPADEAGALMGQTSAGAGAGAGAAPVAHWSASIASVVDPAMVSGWSKAIATAATVAVAGVGGGAAITDRNPLQRFGMPTPAILGLPTVPSFDGSSLPSVVLPGLGAAIGLDAPEAGAPGAPGAAGAVPARAARIGQARPETTTGAGGAPGSAGTPFTSDAPAAGSVASSGPAVKDVIDSLPAQPGAVPSGGDGGVSPVAGKDAGLIGARARDPKDGSGASGAVGGDSPGPVSGVIEKVRPDGGAAPPSSTQAGTTVEGVSGSVQDAASQAAGGGLTGKTGVGTPEADGPGTDASGAAGAGAGVEPAVVDTVSSTVTGALTSTSPASPVR